MVRSNVYDNLSTNYPDYLCNIIDRRKSGGALSWLAISPAPWAECCGLRLRPAGEAGSGRAAQPTVALSGRHRGRGGSEGLRCAGRRLPRDRSVAGAQSPPARRSKPRRRSRPCDRVGSRSGWFFALQPWRQHDGLARVGQGDREAGRAPKGRCRDYRPGNAWNGRDETVRQIDCPARRRNRRGTVR
jgi:hypothetical protein